MFISPRILSKSNLTILTDSEIYLLLKTDSTEGRLAEARIYEASAISQLAKEAQYFIGSHNMIISQYSWLSFKIAARPVSTTGFVVKYFDTDNTEQTLDPENYFLEENDGTLKITFTANPMPTLFDRPDAVNVTFTAGVTNAANLDPLIKHAITQNTAYWFDKPETVNARFETSFDRVVNIFRLCWV